MPEHKEWGSPTNYRVVASSRKPAPPGPGGPGNLKDIVIDSVETETTLAFLGEVEGIPGVTELELASMTQLLGTETPAGASHFLAPMLSDPEGLVGLYVFVDLLQWVGSGSTPNTFDLLTIVDGRHEDLPGYFVSTTPVTVNSDGSMEGTPFAGDVLVAAIIDGTAVSETRDNCLFGPQPAATLLFPYFEVDLSDPAGATTFISVNNAGEECTLARITLWTDLAVPTLTFYVYLSPSDVQTINLRDVFKGLLPRTAGTLANPECQAVAPPICQPAELDFAPGSLDLSALTADHTGIANPGSGDCAGTDRGNDLAVGYVTVDAVPQCSLLPTVATYEVYQEAILDPETFFFAMDNVLWGDYFYVDFGEDFAQSEPAVHILADPNRFVDGDYTFYGRFRDFDASDARVPLSSSYATRFLNGGPFSGGTDLIVWRDALTPGIGRFACGSLPPWAPLPQRSILGYDEEENSLDLSADPAFPWATQRVATADLVPVSFGWLAIDLSLGEEFPAQAWVTPVMSAFGQFSVGHSAARLDDLCGVQAPSLIDSIDLLVLR